MLQTDLGLGLGGSPVFLQQKRRWLSNWIEVSSVNITSKKPVSASCTYCVAQARRFALFSCRIIWQYALPLTVHPSLVLHRNVVLRESVCPASPKAFFSSFAVVSSSLRIVDSTNSETSSVILEGLPLPGRLEMLPVRCTRTKKAYTPLLLTTMPSSFSIFVMVGALLPLAWW